MLTKNITHLIVGPIATNCWIYPLGEKNAAVIDPGDEAPVIINTLKKLDLIPSYILLTHGHFDHIAALQLLVAAFNSDNPQIAIHRQDSRYLGAEAYDTQSKSIKAAMGNTSLIDTMWPVESRKSMPMATSLLEEGDMIGPFTVLHLPGHTPGSAAFWDKEAGTLFTGDVLFEGTYGRTDLPGGNEKEMYTSLRRLFEMDRDIKVFPGHGDTTTIGREAAMQRLFF
jgi:glyoxylase-like metal-dependent hydrolase (beta-lactamase superfamily II)